MKNDDKVHVVYKPKEEWLKIPDCTPPIISEDLFSKAQYRLKRAKELASRNVKRDNLLRGFSYCKHCGRRFKGSYKQYKTKTGSWERLYYRCSKNNKAYHNNCTNTSWKAEILEPIVWEQVEAILTNPNIVLGRLENMQNTQSNNLKVELTEIEDRLKELHKEQERLLQWGMKGFPEDMIIKENETINSSRAELMKRKAELSERIRVAINYKTDSINIYKTCQTIKENLGELSLIGKRKTLEILGVKIWLGKDTINIDAFIPVREGALSSIPSLR